MGALDTNPLVALFLEQRPALGRFLKARAGASADVEDLLQDLYLKVSAIETTDDVRDPRAFLYRLASNLMMDRWRSDGRARARDGAWRMVNHQTGASEDTADAPSAETVVFDKQRLAGLVRSLTTLPEKTRTVFQMHKFEGVPYAVVAERLQMSRSSVEKHMMEALRVLARATPR